MFDDSNTGSKTSFGDESGRVIWTTKKVEQAFRSFEEGYELKESPFYERKTDYRKGNLVYEYTDEEMAEMRRCAKDIVYFADKYCKVMTDEGYKKIELRDYQKEILLNYKNHRFNILLASRQIGKTITTGIFLVWYMLFNFDRNVLLMTNKGETTIEVIDKIKAIVEGLPFFLKPGILKLDVFKMRFDNGCRLIGQNTTKRGGIGFTIHLLFLDEFAHIHESIKDEFYENVYPVLSSSKVSKIVITSTPNGLDKFHDIYMGAEEGSNEYHSYRVDWWQAPGHDEDWKQRQIANLGSEESFNQQFGNQFLSSDRLLLSKAEIERIMADTREFVFHEFDALDDLQLDYTGLKWDPEFDIDELDSSNFVVSVDIAEGIGRDFSVINIFRVQPIADEEVDKLESPASIYEFFTLDQVGVYRSNRQDPDDFAKILYTILVKVLNQDNTRLVIEYNTYGRELIKNLFTIYPSSNQLDEEIMVKYLHSVSSVNKKVGVRLNVENKKVFCEKAKRAVRDGRLRIHDKNTTNEFKMFGRMKNGTYSAQGGHDDLVMTCIEVVTFMDTADFRDIADDLFESMDTEKRDRIMKRVDEFDFNSEDSALGMDDFFDPNYKPDGDDFGIV
jgi:RNase P subunit RPR2